MLNSSTMELRKAADALLRSQTSPLTTLLTPSVSTRWATSSFRPSQRAFTSSARRYISDTKDPSAVPPASKPEQSNNAQEGAKDTPESGRNWASTGLGSRASSRIIPSKTSAEPDGDYWLKGGLSSENAAMDLLTGFNSARQQRGPNSPLNNKSPLNLDRMLSPDSNRSDVSDVMRNLSAAFSNPAAPKAALRLTPKTGRTVNIGAGIDIGRGFRLLEQSCARNKVRSDFTKQRFHERGGLKRKRLRRERWRRRFMDGFKSTIARVKEMKRQGW